MWKDLIQNVMVTLSFEPKNSHHFPLTVPSLVLERSGGYEETPFLPKVSRGHEFLNLGVNFFLINPLPHFKN